MIPAGVDLRADADHPRFKRTMSAVEGISDEISSLRALPIFDPERTSVAPKLGLE
jgi:hypothetical protein